MYDATKVDLSVVCAKSLGLGIMMTVNVYCLIIGYQPEINLYVLSICIFHVMEFISTAIYNVSQIDDDSFILGDYELLTVNIASIIEYSIMRYLGMKSPIYLRYLGLLMIIIGQVFRTLAMATAKQSFNHYIQRTKLPNHVLITHGVYKVSRHPSYFGFFWWFIGLRVFMSNWVILGVGGYKIWRFFKNRIEFEEGFLQEFFGDYKEYRKRVGVGIPFI